MRHWGHANPKRSIMWSTSSLIRCLNLGKLVGELKKSTYKTSRKYVDRHGVKKFHGTKHLKKSGLLGSSMYKNLGCSSYDSS